MIEAALTRRLTDPLLTAVADLLEEGAMMATERVTFTKIAERARELRRIADDASKLAQALEVLADRTQA